MFFISKNKHELNTQVQLILADDKTCHISEVCKEGFIVDCSISELAYYLNFDKQLEGLVKLFGSSFFTVSNFSPISGSRTLLKLDIEKSNSKISAIFNKVYSMKDLNNELLERFNSCENIPKDWLVIKFLLSHIEKDTRTNTLERRLKSIHNKKSSSLNAA